MNYQLRILARARADVDVIYDWIYERSPGGAARWYSAFLEACGTVATQPLRFGVAIESKTVGYEIREYYFKTPRGRRYRGLFTIVGDEIRVLRVRGPGQSPVALSDLR